MSERMDESKRAWSEFHHARRVRARTVEREDMERNRERAGLAPPFVSPCTWAVDWWLEPLEPWEP